MSNDASVADVKSIGSRLIDLMMKTLSVVDIMANASKQKLGQQSILR